MMIPSQKTSQQNQKILPQNRLKTLCEQNAKVWMGIVNLSSQSFSFSSNGSAVKHQFADLALSYADFTERSLLQIPKILKRAEQLIKNGAHILDIGAVPTNPSILNALVDPQKELEILYPAVNAIKNEFGSDALISVDTYSPTVAHALASENLIDIINDIYGGRKTEEILINSCTQKHQKINMLDVVAQFSLGYVLMHMSGVLDALTQTAFGGSVDEYLNKVLEFFEERKAALAEKKISFCVFDPGIGAGRFGKNLEQNLALLSQKFIQKLSTFGFPILVGLSRKSFLKDLNPMLVDPKSRDDISKEWEIRSFARGVNIIRTHKLYPEKILEKFVHRGT